MTRLRRMMLEELERRNYAQGTTRCHLRAVTDFARYFYRPPDQLRPTNTRIISLIASYRCLLFAGCELPFDHWKRG